MFFALLDHKVRPDFVGDDGNAVFPHQIDVIADLFFGPNTAGGIVRVAENRNADAFFLDLFLHILKIHAVNAVFVLYQRGRNDIHIVIFKDAGKANVGRRMHQNGIAGLWKGM